MIFMLFNKNNFNVIAEHHNSPENLLYKNDINSDKMLPTSMCYLFRYMGDKISFK